MKQEVFLRLEESEATVVAAASRIYAAYVAAGQLTDGNEKELLRSAVRAAIRLAVLTDQVVQSDDEQGLAGLGGLLD